MTKNKESTRYYSHKQEQYIAKLLNGKLQANSGATGFDKGDVLLEDWLIECKTTMTPKKSFSIKKDWLDKNELERVEMLRPYSALAFQFMENGENYFVVNEKVFKKLLEGLNND